MKHWWNLKKFFPACLLLVVQAVGLYIHLVQTNLLQMAVAHLGLDKCVQPPQTIVFFKQNADSTFAMPPCKDFVAESSSALTGSSVSKRRSKTAHTFASMAEADFIGVGRAPEIEQPVAALVVSPDEAVRGNVRCPSAQCGRTDTLLKKVCSLLNSGREYHLPAAACL
ncbi:hypothetical protein QQF64_026237 [Cirrhinus molitorella]|uniref:Uncharacterized protein n=1 Tax=Cirrhinus molitorella TaxID=172907 RepID=A0ABR3NRL1_9TELE